MKTLLKLLNLLCVYLYCAYAFAGKEDKAVIPLPSAESREVSVVPEMEKSLEPARKKRRVAKLDEAIDEDSEVSKFCRRDVRREEQNSILGKLEELGKQEETIRKLSLITCRIEVGFIKKLLPLPVLKELKVLKLNNNPIGDAGAILIAQWLKGNRTLEELHLKGYGISGLIGKKGGRCILKAMEKSKLRFIDMSGNDFPGSETCMWDEDSGIPRSEFVKKQLEALGVAEVDEATDDDSVGYYFCYSKGRKGEHNTILEELKKFKEGEKIGTLSLNQCRIGEDFIKKLLGLPILQTVEELWLNGNPIGDAGAAEIAEWLRKNKTLKELHLKGYGVGQFCTGKNGAKCILEAIGENDASKLKFIDMSGNNLLGCIWDEGSGIPRSEFVKKQLAILDGSIAAGDETMDEDEENPEDKTSGNVDVTKNPNRTSQENPFEDGEMWPYGLEVDEVMDKDEENPEDKTSGNVDITENPNRTSQENPFEGGEMWPYGLEVDEVMDKDEENPEDKASGNVDITENFNKTSQENPIEEGSPYYPYVSESGCGQSVFYREEEEVYYIDHGEWKDDLNFCR
ncbi:MAG: hypothetical protein ACSW8C_00670 [bacterium]